MNANSDNKKTEDMAQVQVKAFMELLKKEHDLDEAKIARILQVAQKNGKVYVTWAWIIAILVGLVGILGSRQLSVIDSRMDRFETRQADVRERLHAIEAIIKQTLERNK
jgi:hypothetical protein